MFGLVDFLLILASVDEHVVFADVSHLYSSSVECSSAGFRLVSDKVLNVKFYQHSAFDGLVIYIVIITEAHGDGEHENFFSTSFPLWETKMVFS